MTVSKTEIVESIGEFENVVKLKLIVYVSIQKIESIQTINVFKNFKVLKYWKYDSIKKKYKY